MAAVNADQFILQRHNGTAFEDIGGFTTNSFTINRETVDITTKQSDSWRQLLRDAGLKTVSASGDGVFLDDTGIEAVRLAIFNDNIGQWQLVFPGYGTFKGDFAVTSLEYSGEKQGHVTYSIALESSGEVSFDPAV